MNPLTDHPYVHQMELAYTLGFIVLGILVVMLARTGSKALFSLLPLFATFAHQTEEYIISPLILGEEFHFLNWFYRTGVDLSPLGVVVINVIAWGLALLLLAFKPKSKPWLFYNLFLLATVFANGIFHLGVATAESAYNPGALTSLVAYMPLFLMAVIFATREGITPRPIIALSLYGFIAHFILIWLVVPLFR